MLPLFAFYTPNDGWGGPTTVVNVLTRSLMRRGWDVERLVRANEPHRSHVDGPRSRKMKFPSVWSLSRYLERERPRVLMSFDDRCNLDAIVARGMARQSGSLIMSYHGSLWPPSYSLYQSARKVRNTATRFLVLRFLVNWATAVVTVSSGVRSQVLRMYPNITVPVVNLRQPLEVDRIRSLASDPDAIAPNVVAWVREGIPTVVNVCDFNRFKGLPTLLQAFALALETRTMRLVLVGDGDLAQDLKHLANDLGISRSVEFVGYRDNPYPYMAAAGVFVSSSTSEGLSMSMLEAMACGTTVVGTDKNLGVDDVMDGGGYGRVVPANDPPALAAAILDSLDNPVDEEALLRASREFDVERYVDRLLQLAGA